MRSKVDNPLKLKNNGRVLVTGPIEEWDSDEVRAVFWVLLCQDGPNGCVTAAGTSEMYLNGAGSWDATAKLVEDAGPQLQPGAATAYATAMIYEDGVFNYYTWTVPTALVSN